MKGPEEMEGVYKDVDEIADLTLLDIYGKIEKQIKLNPPEDLPFVMFIQYVEGESAHVKIADLTPLNNCRNDEERYEAMVQIGHQWTEVEGKPVVSIYMSSEGQVTKLDKDRCKADSPEQAQEMLRKAQAGEVESEIYDVLMVSGLTCSNKTNLVTSRLIREDGRITGTTEEFRQLLKDGGVEEISMYASELMTSFYRGYVAGMRGLMH